MAFTPISNTVPQYEENGVAASGYFIKFYEAGTTTPTAMAADSTGTTLLDKCELNTEGYPINGSNAVFIPHINKKYKIALFRNAADADANDLASAAWPAVDGLLPVLSEGDGQVDTIANLRLLKPSFDGQQVDVLGHTLAGIGDGQFYYDPDDTTSADNNGTVIVTSSGERWKRILNGYVSPEMFGALYSGADEKTELQSAIDFVEGQNTKSDNFGTIKVLIGNGSITIGTAGDSYGIEIINAAVEGINMFGSSIVWGGDAGGTIVRYDSVYRTPFRKIRFKYSDNMPATCIDASWKDPSNTFGVFTDFGDFFKEIFFCDCTGPQLVLVNIVNAYLKDVRFSSGSNLVLVKQDGSGSARRVISLRGWTVDYSLGATGVLESMFKVDLTGAASVTLSLEDARIEGIGTDLGGVKAIVEVIDTVGPNLIPATGISLVMKDIGVQMVGATGVSLIYHNTTQTSVTSDVMLENVYLSGVDKIYGGNWNSFFKTPEPEVINNKNIVLWKTGRVESTQRNRLPDHVGIGKDLLLGDEVSGITLSYGSGSPEGVRSDGKGSVFMRETGSAGFTSYLKTTAKGTATGWVNTTVWNPESTGGSGSAGAGNQYVSLNIGGFTYKILHDGTL